MATADSYTRTNPRHRIMVEYTSYGKSVKDISEATGYAEAYVRAIQRSPLFQSEVQNVQDQLKQNTMAKFAEKLTEEALPSLTTLVSIRDNTNTRDSDRVTAADKIIGRTLDVFMPKRGQGDDGKRVTKLVIEGGDLHSVINAIREVDGKAPLQLDAPIEVQAEPTDPEGRIQPVTIEQMIAADEDTEQDRW